MIVELLILASVLLLIRYLTFKSRAEKMLKNFPGPKPYPFIGNILEFDYPRKEITDTFKECSYKYGPVSVLRIGPRPTVFLRDPVDVETVLGNTSEIHKSVELYWPLQPWLKEGLLTSGGEKWRRHRKIITPAFHFSVLDKFVPVFVKNSNTLIDKLAFMTNKDLDIIPLIALCSLDIIGESAMGIEINAQRTESEYVDAVNGLLEIVSYRNFSLIQRTPLFSLMPVGRRHDKLVTYLHKVTEHVLEERKSKLQEESTNKINTSDIEDDFGVKKKKAFLDLLLDYNAVGAGMTDADIRDEVDTFMFEGYDTTTSTMAFCLYCLSKNQDVQERALEEILKIFKDSDRDATHKDLQEMKYLEKVIKETMRIYPTVQFVGRQTQDDIELKSGYTIPKNTSVTMLIEAMNHDPGLHTDPFKFDPERFDSRNLHPFTYIPFAAGPRNCIGQKYAMLEVKTVVSKLLTKFQVLPSDILVTPTFNIVLKSRTGVHVKLVPRQDKK